MQIIFNFVFYYPLLMAFVLMIGGAVYHFLREPKRGEIILPQTPLVSVLVPCHNEEQRIRETINYLEKQEYLKYEIIAINDGSTDGTLNILMDIEKDNPRLRVVNLSTNQGKGRALTMGALASKGEYLVCIDADAILDPSAIKYLLWHFLNFPRVGAVTGNPRIRNRTSIIGKIQVGEFSAMVGMIKRAQRVLGKIYTVSGVIAAFRKTALYSVGFWSNDMLTEDVDVSWKLQLKFWDIRYEPRALCWILMPETITGLWRQRLRWAQGGGEVLHKYFHNMFDWRQRRFWFLYIEYIISIFWAYMLFMTFAFYFLNLFVKLPHFMVVKSIIPGWTGTILAMACLVQLALGLMFDSRSESKIFKIFFWLIWYPLIYWVLNAAVTVVGFPKGMSKIKSVPAIWDSPDRGL